MRHWTKTQKKPNFATFLPIATNLWHIWKIWDQDINLHGRFVYWSKYQKHSWKFIFGPFGTTNSIPIRNHTKFCGSLLPAPHLLKFWIDKCGFLGDFRAFCWFCCKKLFSEPWIVKFGVKLYPPDPTHLVEEITRLYVYRQIRDDIAKGRLLASFVTHSLLGSLAAQAEIGDAPKAYG